MSSEKEVQALQFWKKMLQRCPQKVTFLQCNIPGEEKSWGHFTLAPEKEIWKRLEGLAGLFEADLELMLQVFLAILLGRYNGVECVAFGWQQGSCPDPFTAGNVDCCTEQLIYPVVISINPGDGVSDVIMKNKQHHFDSRKYGLLPYQVVEEHYLLKEGPLELVFSLDDPLGRATQERCMVKDKQRELHFTCQVSGKDEALLQRVSLHFMHLVRQVADAPYGACNELELITEAEKKEILTVFNRKTTFYNRDKSLSQLFEEQVEQDPHHPALVGAGLKFSYAELNKRANVLGERLLEAGLKRGEVVGVFLERSPLVVVSILAIWKVGGIYLPLDPENPLERLSSLVELGQPVLLLADTQRAGIPLSFPGAVLDPRDAAPGPKNNGSYLPGPDGGDSPACLMFTSGSTGQPRGVLLRHSALHNGFHGDQKHFYFDTEDVYLFKSSLTFVTSLCEILSPLLSGGCVAVLEPGEQGDVSRLVRAIKEYGVTYLEFVPAMLDLFLEYVAHLELWQDVSPLKVVFASGEALSLATIKRFNKTLYRKNGTLLYNSYGLTETTVDVSYARCSTKAEPGLVSIGKPVDNVHLYVLDDYYQLLPPGVAGTLWVGGETLAVYLKEDDHTKSRYYEHPLLRERLFNTGDRARWLQGGELEYLGRVDSRVKIRGHRVEPAEVEQQILRHEYVRQVAVLAVADKRTLLPDTILCAYIVPAPGYTAERLHSHLAASLPAYMIPSYLISLTRMPLNAHGKVDRNKLPEPPHWPGDRTGRAELQLPAGPLEEKICSIWQQVLGLGVGAMGAEEDFFELGGNSLLAILMQISVQKELTIEIPLAEIFKGITIRKIANMALRERQQKKRRSRSGKKIVLLNSRQERKLFCFSPIIGFGFFYQPLAAYITTHAVYGLDFTGEEYLIAEYLRLIISRQPQGPYTLLGYSAGGNLAFEVARELERLGFEVGDLILVDSEKEEKVVQRSPENLEREANLLFRDVVMRYFSKYIMSELARSVVLERICKNLQFTDGLVNRGTIKGRIHLLKALSDNGAGPNCSGANTTKSWAESTCSLYSEYAAAGTHYEMLYGSHIESNAKQVQQILERSS